MGAFDQSGQTVGVQVNIGTGAEPAQSEPWPDTFEVIIGVDKTGNDAFLLHWPAFIGDWIENGCYAVDNGFTNIPKEPGVYKCTVAWQYARDDSPEFPISQTVKVLDTV